MSLKAIQVRILYSPLEPPNDLDFFLYIRGMSQLSGIKLLPDERKHINDTMLKEFALGVLLSNHGNQMSFRASDLAECANLHSGIAVNTITSEVIGEEKIVVLTLIEKGQEEPEKRIITLD